MMYDMKKTSGKTWKAFQPDRAGVKLRTRTIGTVGTMVLVVGRYVP
jgi:hypothetical protein